MTAVVVPPFPVLTYVERFRSPHAEHSAESTWLDITRFLFDRDITDESTLDALVRHAYYRDDHLVPGSPLTPHATRHGPYRLDCLTTESFELTDRASAEETLYRWAEGSTSATDQQRLADIRTAERIITAATTIYHLKDLRETCEHEDGRLLGDFHELVLLNRHDGILAVLVASMTREGRTARPSSTP